MLNCLINTVLSDVLRWEFIIVSGRASKRYCVVHVIDILLGPLSEITDKPVQIMTFRHFDCAVLVVVYFGQFIR